VSNNILFFQNKVNPKLYYTVEYKGIPTAEEQAKLEYLTNGTMVDSDTVTLTHPLIGTRKERITPFSTSATGIALAIGLENVMRVENFVEATSEFPDYDVMLNEVYPSLGQDMFKTDRQPQPVKYIEDLHSYNKEHGLAISDEEIDYLIQAAQRRGRLFTDAEIFGFSQANSEHCRHKIFNGTFIIDGKEQAKTLFQMIKETTIDSNSLTGYKGAVLNAYADNAAAVGSAKVMQWAPGPDGKMVLTPIEVSALLKAETHNHPTGVSPFPGAATGTGGEIRDRMAVGLGSHPLSGGLVVMTNDPAKEGNYLYSSAQKILTEATDGAFHYGNEFGQPLVIPPLVYAFTHEENGIKWGYNKPILLASGLGYVDKRYMHKDDSKIKKGQKIILLGGSNYLIGLGGGSASSLNSGAASKKVDFASVQRDNAEMQNRAYRVTRALTEGAKNPIVSIHDHGAGGHFNCLVELVEKLGGRIDMSKLPVDDKTMSAKEILSNESQERMAILVNEDDVESVMEIAAREGCPAYEIGEITGDNKFVCEQENGERPVDMEIADLMSNPPKTIIKDSNVRYTFATVEYSDDDFIENLKNVLGMLNVGSTDWMVNKADCSVKGLTAAQARVGALQLPICKYGISRFDYTTDVGIAGAKGYAPAATLINAGSGARLALADALLGLIFTPLKDGRQSIEIPLEDQLQKVFTSANWMWPCKNPGEDARLYAACQALSNFAQQLGVTIPTGKDSLSMTQKVDGDKIMAPGTVILTASGLVENIDKKVLPVMQPDVDSELWHIDMSNFSGEIGGSCFAQSLGFVGNRATDVQSKPLSTGFDAIQELVQKGLLLAGQSISRGGMITSVLEMAFAADQGGVKLDIPANSEKLFSEAPGVVVQVSKENIAEFRKILFDNGALINADKIGEPSVNRWLSVGKHSMHIDALREAWMKPSHDLEKYQNKEAEARKRNQLMQPLVADSRRLYKNVNIITGAKKKTTCAVLRDNGTNGDREMMYAAKLGGFDNVLDVHMSDLITGKKDLGAADFLILAGGFSNADAFRAGTGWAAKLKYNLRANDALMNFINRDNTLTLGICNGCQVIQELGLIGGTPAPMQRNDSGKFEAAFVSTHVPANNAVIMKDLSEIQLPVWVAHGEGKFNLSGLTEGKDYQTVMKYAYSGYPGNPNGSPDKVAGIASMDGRVVAMMPHPERAVQPYQWAWNPGNMDCQISTGGIATPWLKIFAAAHNHAATK